MLAHDQFKELGRNLPFRCTTRAWPEISVAGRSLREGRASDELLEGAIPPWVS
jgi:hypothetical protein